MGLETEAPPGAAPADSCSGEACRAAGPPAPVRCRHQEERVARAGMQSFLSTSSALQYNTVSGGITVRGERIGAQKHQGKGGRSCLSQTSSQGRCPWDWDSAQWHPGVPGCTSTRRGSTASHCYPAPAPSS